LAFLAVTLGNIIAQRLLNKHSNREWHLYKFFRIIFAVFILIFAFQKSIIGFMAWYAGVYLLLGASNIAESTLVNKLTPNHMRASVLSLNSFTTQIGVLIASLFSSIMIEWLQIAGVWLAAGGLLGGYATFVAVATYKREYESDMSLQQSAFLEKE
jgi:predicted MFS family arabinose efflux permease